MRQMGCDAKAGLPAIGREHGFDRPEKGRGWHTALYYFAEHVRVLSGGRINHKALYSRIGTKGHYINHENPIIRKRTAAALSRIVHSRRYVEDLRESCAENPHVFDGAAAWICGEALAHGGGDAAGLLAYVAGPLWRDVQRGLESEWEDGRSELNLPRISNEMSSLLARCEAMPPGRFCECAAKVLSSCLCIMTFGHLDPQFVYSLFDETPLTREAGAWTEADGGQGHACLIKYVEGDPAAIVDAWEIDPRQPFFIGRYTDCDVIEANPYVSRRHCRIWHRDGEWFLEDLGSRYGTRVLRGAAGCVYDSSLADAPKGCGLRYGDRIVLADGSFYWFGSVCMPTRSPFSH